MRILIETGYLVNVNICRRAIHPGEVEEACFNEDEFPLRLDPTDIKSVEAIAKKKSLSYTALLRMWIKEHLDKESKRVA